MPPDRRDVVYSADAGERGVGDLFLPKDGRRREPVLLIHGGGWNALSKESIEFLVPPFVKAGHPVFSINYRLLDQAPWPACGDDCLAAAHFLLGGGLAEVGGVSQIIICGASAGGHLAMMTGLRLTRERVSAVLSLAGPSRLDLISTNRDPLGMHDGFARRFFGSVPDVDEEMGKASPALVQAGNRPPLFCLHSRNDLLVPLLHAEEAVRAWDGRGSRAELTTFAGDGSLHGFWIDDDREGGRLRPEVPEFIASTLNHLP